MATEDGNSDRGQDFDPVTASTTIRTIAELAERCERNGIALEREFVRNAIAELRVAQEWLDARLADFNMAYQRPLLTQGEDEEPIGAEALVQTLRCAAIELLQVHRLLELRSFRKKR